MASQATATEESHSYYPPSPWVQSIDTPPISGTTTPASSIHPASPWSASSATPLSASDHSNSHAALAAHAAQHQLDIWPLLLPRQTSIYQAQLLHYTNLISPGRGGGLQQTHQSPSSNGVSTPSATHQTPSRSRASSKVSNKENSSSKSVEKGHGNKGAHTKEKGDRAVIAAAKEGPPHTMPHQKTQRQAQQPEPAAAAAAAVSSSSATAATPTPAPAPASGTTTSTTTTATTTTTTTATLPLRPRTGPKHSPQPHSSSVPSTPQQHARNFSYESREPSPTHNANHSPRSAYSETNSALPSLRPLQGCPYETAQNRFRRRMPYNIGSGGLEKVDPASIKAKLSEEHEKKLTADMRELYDRLLPTPKVEENRKKLCAKLEKIFNDEWPGRDIRVHLFGSSGNLLCSDDSDVDICITTPWKELEGVCIIADLLHKKGMKKVVCISAAKVPIVKIWDPELSLACDMNVNNTLALENTRMVRTYIEIDPRIRPLAMIIKYWTRRRVLNDAAFGSTLSSYTWICMIIAFLQLRDVPIVPALHQRLPKRAGQPDSAFADDLDKLRGFGDKNKSTLGELLFQFFRYYAHEFDYEKHVLSVRQGRKLSKTEKKWSHNLCVEEPFNTGRNLGNTADEYSFRGLHMELRRAFDAIAEADLEKCCEQFVFPKEETPTFIRPPNAPRPVMIRSSSGANAGRGGRNNYRGGRNANSNRNGNSNRRASSSVAYDTNTMYMPPVTMTPQELAWYAQQQQQQQQQQSQQLQYPTMLYTQAQVYQQMQAHMAAQYVQQQRAQASTTQAAQMQQQQQQQQQSSSSTERSRTNSVDMAPPLTAPLSGHEWYAMYGFPYQAFYHNGYAYPQSPATAVPNGTTPSEYRRSTQRSPLSSEAGATAAGSSLRSQSQPASRSVSNAQGPQYSGSAPQATGIVAGARQANGGGVPSFIADEREVDTTMSGPLSDSPPPSDEGSGSYIGYYVRDAASPSRPPPQTLPSGLAFGDLAQSATQGRRRLSTEQLPQTLLDRRIRRASRSPSPLGHCRAFSVGTSPNTLPPSPLPGGANGGRSAARPLIVNGSGSSLRTSSTHSQATLAPATATATDDSARVVTNDNPLQIHGYGFSSHHTGSVDSQSSAASETATQPAAPERTGPVIVNGSSSAPSISAPSPSQGQASAAYHSEEASFRERIMMNQHLTSQALSQQDFRFSPASGRTKVSSRAAQNGGIAPLEFSTGSSSRINGHGQSVDAQHLSPIDEKLSPSPTNTRKGEMQLPSKVKRPSNLAEEVSGTKAAPPPEVKQAQQPARATASQLSQVLKLNGTGRENGHVRGAKSESHSSDGGWQKATKGRKKGGDVRNTGGTGSSEQPPQHDADRKGG